MCNFPFSKRKLLPLACVSLVVLLLSLLPAARSEAPPETPELPPFVLRPISLDRLPREMEKVRQGALVQLPFADFEERLRQARAGAAIKRPPRLLEARYRAVLKDNALHGIGQWKTSNPDAGPAILRLQPLNLALRRLRFENRDALLADFDGRTPGLLLEEAGQHTVSVEWTARGDPSPEGLLFDLRLPACAVAALELDLPDGHTVSVSPDGCLVSGPHPADDATLHRWKIGFAGRSQLHLTIRTGRGTDRPPPLVLAALQTTQKINPDSLDAEFLFDLKVLHQGVRELRCECDPQLRPYDVSAPNLESWELLPPAPSPPPLAPLGERGEETAPFSPKGARGEETAPFSPKGERGVGGEGGLGGASLPHVLVVRLREPLQTGTLRVACLAPLEVPSTAPPTRAPRQVSWTSPGMRLSDAVLRGETLVLHVHPDVRLLDWQPGVFRLLKAHTEPDGTRVWTLGGGSLDGQPQGPSQRRPSARIQTQQVEFVARQLTWWQVGPEKASLWVEVSYDVTHGRLFELTLALPPGWDVDRPPELSPPGRIRTWGVRQVQGRSLLIMEPERPLAPPARGGPLAAAPLPSRPIAPRLTVQLRWVAGVEHSDAPAWSTGASKTQPRPPVPTRPPGGALAEMAFPFPDVVPLGARLLEGALAVDFDQQLYEAFPDTSAQPAPPDEEGPWGRRTPDYYYPYRGRGVQGTLRLRQRAPRVRARCSSEVVLASGRAALAAHLFLHPEAGSTDAIDVTFSAPLTGTWNWKVVRGNNQVRAFERLPAGEAAPRLAVLGAGTPLASAGLLAVPLAAGERWRLSFTGPLREPLTLHGSGELGRPARQGRWDVPLLNVPSASHMDGEVKLFLSGADVVQIDAEGLREARAPVAAGPRGPALSPWRTFSYGPPPAALTLRGQAAEAANRSAEVAADNARLTTYVEPGGRLLQHYRFQLWNWRQQTVPVRLPAAARLLAVRVEGRWAAQLPAARVVEDSLVVDLPAPVPDRAGPASERAMLSYEILYDIDGPRWLLWARLEAEPPKLPVATLAYRHIWCLPPGVAPLLDGRQRGLPGPAAGQPWERGGLGAWERLPRAAAVELWRSGSLPLFGEREAGQEQAMAAAAAELARSRPITLGELINRLAFDYLREQGPLVLDAVALHEAGLTPSTPLPAPSSEPSANGTPLSSPSSLPPGEGEGRMRGETRSDDSPLWEDMGLVYVPCRMGALLTARRQLASWRTTDAGPGTSEAIEAAVAEAAIRGHDSSGRFWSAADWLRRGPDPERGGPYPAPFAALGTEFPWAEWEPIAGVADDSVLLVVRHEIMPGIGLALAALLCLVFWLLGPGGNRRRLAFLLIWLAVAGLAILWLPPVLHGLAWWPLVAGSVIALVWYLWSAGKARSTATAQDNGPTGESPAPRPVTPSAVLALLVVGGLAGQAAAPDEPGPRLPATVFLVPGPADAPEKQTVLAPPELLAQLEAAARQKSSGPRDPVLLSATYQGEVIDSAAEFRAVFQVYCPTDKPAPLLLPLDGIQLQEDISLDGTRAYPIAARPPQAGYVIKVKDRGVHTVQLCFRVPVQAQDDERSVRFTAPGLLQNRLTLDVPPGARYLQALIGLGPARGAQQVSTGTRGGLRLEADLGRLSPVLPPPGPLPLTAPLQVRWWQERRPPRAPTVQVRETYLWTLRADASNLTAILRYAVSRAPVTTLTLDLPEGLEVQAVDATPPAGSAGARLKDWRVVADRDGRRLEIEFNGPVLGEVPVTVQLLPGRPFGTAAELPLPTPRAEPAPEPALLAYRLDGLNAKVVEYKSLTYYDPAKFAETWQKAGRPEPMPPKLAFFFRRRPGDAPLLRLELSIPPAAVRAVQDITWRVSHQQAEFRATARLTAPKEDLALVEWDVPAAVETITGVSGPDVHHWTRSGSRVQVWLRRSVGSTEVQLAGWMPLRPGPKGGPTRFPLPAVRLVSVRAQRIFVRLTAGGDTALVAGELQNLWPLPDPRLSDQELSYIASQATYRGTFLVRPSETVADVKVLTFVEVRDRELAFVARVDYQVRQGELRRAAVRLRNWPGEVRLEAPEPAQGTPSLRGLSGDRIWTVSLPPGVTGRYRLTLTGSMPLEKAAAGVPVPDVTVPRASDRSERWLALGGHDLILEAPQGLVPATEPERELRPWPGEADRLRRKGGQVWRIEPGEWAPRLLPRPRPATAPVQVFLTEQTAAVADGRRWAHQAVYWLVHDANTDLTVRLPDGARIVNVLIDETPVTPLQPSPRLLWLPLPGGAGVRAVRLRWVFDPEAERLDQPRLDRPRLEGVTEGPSLWTVHVPAGYRVSLDPESRSWMTGASKTQPQPPQPQPVSGAGLDVARAEAFFRLSAHLVGQGRGADRQLAIAQRRFYEYCRYAEQGLASAQALLAAASGPGGLASPLEELHESNQEAARRLQELFRQNRELAQKHGFEDLRAGAERQARAPEPAGSHRPLAPPEPAGSHRPLAPPPPRTMFPVPAGGDGERIAGPRGGTLPERGVPLHWQGDPETPAPRLRLTLAQAGQTRQALAASLLLLVLLVVAWVVAHFPGIFAWVRAFWPEQMALLGCIGWQTLGPNLVVVFLILLGVCARLVVLVQAALALLRRWRPAAAATGEAGPPA
ncbi:MAG TPA: hypothetical protein VNK04_18720 [Gemmataceae bacterium]|nr:hypothetical protein [Gemmataceae bacterium]